MRPQKYFHNCLPQPIIVMKLFRYKSPVDNVIILGKVTLFLGGLHAWVPVWVLYFIV